jgi:hypothetical protein
VGAGINKIFVESDELEAEKNLGDLADDYVHRGSFDIKDKR